MKKKYMAIWAAVLFLMLTGCGTKQVAYEEEKSSGKKNSEISQEESAGTTLMETLGVEEEWKEKVSLDDGESFNISAEVSVPDAPKMSLLEVSEYYYTPEDKKRVAEYFLDEGSIQVNVEHVPTKERIAAKVQEWEMTLEKIEEEGIEDKIAVAKSEKKKLESLLNEAPKADEIELSPGDYKEDYYAGLKEGKELVLDFDIREEEHISQWILCAADAQAYKEFNEAGAEFWNPANTSDNKCTMTKEEAELKAEQICEELGITGMAPVRVKTVQWGDQKENNGYYIVLGRENAGVVMEPVTYFTGSEIFYRNTELGGKTPYEQEIIDIGINDNGVFWMRYSGILSVDKEGTEVKLLTFNQIKEAFRIDIISRNDVWSMDANNLDLIYFRFMDEKQQGKYTYVPVWRLTPYEMESGMGVGASEWNCIFINAIDGSPVDIDEVGGTYYMDPEVVLYDYE